jgi:hypothetical protein
MDLVSESPASRRGKPARPGKPGGGWPRWERATWSAAFAAAAVSQVCWWLRVPVGIQTDEALHLTLARSLLGGAFALPDASGYPVNDPLPGFPALAAPFVWLFQPHWLAVRAVILAGTWAGLFLVWRLARRILPPRWAAAAALLTAVHPALCFEASLVKTDVWFAMLGVAALAALPEKPTLRRCVLVGALASVAAMVRPEGALLALALATALAAFGQRAGAAIILAESAVPLGLWSLRNYLLRGASSGYLTNWPEQMRPLWSVSGQSLHAARILASFFGFAVLPSTAVPWPLMTAAGALLTGLAGYGVLRLLRERPSPWILASALYAIAFVSLHLTWVPEALRYSLPLLPIVWIFAAAGASALPIRPSVWPWLGVPLLLASLAGAYPKWLRDSTTGGDALPKTVAWVREHLPIEARIESVLPQILLLETGHRVYSPQAISSFRDTWLAELAALDFDYFISIRFTPDGFFPSRDAYFFQNVERWAQSSRCLEIVHQEAAEGSIVFKVKRPEAQRLSRAYAVFEQGGVALRRGKIAFAKKKLLEAVQIDPELSLAWAALGRLEPKPSDAVLYLKKAVEADPTSEMMAQDLRRAEEEAAKKPRK